MDYKLFKKSFPYVCDKCGEFSHTMYDFCDNCGIEDSLRNAEKRDYKDYNK